MEQKGITWPGECGPSGTGLLEHDLMCSCVYISDDNAYVFTPSSTLILSVVGVGSRDEGMIVVRLSVGAVAVTINF